MIYDLETPADRQRIVSAITALKEGVRWVVTIKRFRRISPPQFRYLHVCLACIARETGNTLVDVKEGYKAMFLPRSRVRIFDRELDIPASTKTLDTKQLTDFIEAIRSDAAQQGIELPRPGDRHFERFYEEYKDYIG